MKRRSHILLVAGCVAGCLSITLATGCETYRIEYHRRPAYYERMVEGPLPDRERFDDGTIAVYTSDLGSPSTSRLFTRTADDGDGEEEGNPFRLREEKEDGTVILRAFLPEHIIAHTLNCLRYEEYEMFWNELVSERTKLAYEAEGKGVEEFSAHFRKHRLELAKMFNRMRIGMATHETVVENIGSDRIQCRFWPKVAVLFKFKRVVMVREDFGLKLLRIE